MFHAGFNLSGRKHKHDDLFNRCNSFLQTSPQMRTILCSIYSMLPMSDWLPVFKIHILHIKVVQKVCSNFSESQKAYHCNFTSMGLHFIQEIIVLQIFLLLDSPNLVPPPPPPPPPVLIFNIWTPLKLIFKCNVKIYLKFSIPQLHIFHSAFSYPSIKPVARN